MSSKVSGIPAARTSRAGRAHLSLAPEPGSIPAVDESPEQRAYQAGKLDALAGALDLRYRALAGLDRLESMDIEELDTLADIVAGIAASKRADRPALSLVGSDYGVAYLACAAVTAAAASPALESDVADDYAAAGQSGLVRSFTRAVAEQRALTEGGVA